MEIPLLIAQARFIIGLRAIDDLVLTVCFQRQVLMKLAPFVVTQFLTFLQSNVKGFLSFNLHCNHKTYRRHLRRVFRETR